MWLRKVPGSALSCFLGSSVCASSAIVGLISVSLPSEP